MRQGPIILRQSLIKALNHGQELDELTEMDNPQCPAKAKAIYLEGMKSPASEAMTYGNFMETILWGATETGEVTTIPRKNGTQKREVQIRIEKNAWMFRNRWMEEMRMDMHEVHPKILIKLGDRYKFRASMDFYTSMQDGETYYPRVICDLKMTASTKSTYGPFSWGNAQSMDHTQAVAYSWAYEVKHKEQVPFYYFVISYNKLYEHLRVRVNVDALKKREFLTALQRTADLIDNYDTKGKWPEAPSNDNCRNCPLKESCDSYRVGGKVVTVY